MSAIDLTGQTFGPMKALSPTDKRYHRCVVWRCQCTSCGAERDIPAIYLRDKKTNISCEECGAGSPERSKSGPKRGSPNIKNVLQLEGQVFGELTALFPTDRRIGGNIVWRCKCSCGKICYIGADDLVHNRTKSCGHLRSTSRRIDITGMRSGRLVADHPIKNTADYRGPAIWLCRCDCGSVRIVRASYITHKSALSCGCVQKSEEEYLAKCPSCGGEYPIVFDGSPTPQFCPKCTQTHEGREWRVCPICSHLFPASPSSNAVTCSKKCSSSWKSITFKGISRRWSEEAKQTLAQKGQTANLKLGTEAAKKSPVAGRFETNREAKIWTLISPDGREIVVRNLLLWARENTELFGKPPGDKSATQIACGFKAIAQTLLGKPRGAYTYFGWTLKCPPEEPPD